MIVLFRHGQSDHNVENRISCGLDSRSELTDFGKNGVRESAKKLKEEISELNYAGFPKWVKIYASPLLRTKQTAEIICDTFKIDKRRIIFDERLKEVQYGEYDDHSITDLPHNVYDIDKFKEAGCETYEDVDKRMFEFVDDVLKDPRDFDYIVVSHALPIREVNKKLTGIEEKIKVGEYFIIK